MSNTVRINVEKNNKLGEIIYIHDTINNTYVAYPKGNEKLVVKGSSKENVYQELKRIYKRLKETD
jgi:hypothetical protein